MLVPATNPPPEVHDKTISGVIFDPIKNSQASSPKLPWPAIIYSLSGLLINIYRQFKKRNITYKENTKNKYVKK